MLTTNANATDTASSDSDSDTTADTDPTDPADPAGTSSATPATSMATFDSGGVVDALAAYVGSIAPLQSVVSLACVNKAYNQSVIRQCRTRLTGAEEAAIRLIGTEWIRKYRDAKRRSDVLLERVVTQAELRGCINDDLVKLDALRTWMTKKLCHIGVSRQFSIATTAYLRSRRPSEEVADVLDRRLIRRMLLGRCQCGHLPCKSPDLKLCKLYDSLVFTCRTRRRRSPNVSPKAYY